jgi:predicted membrane protein
VPSNINIMNTQNESKEPNFKNGRILSGIILILVGSLFFAKKLGVLFPEWLFTWPMFLVALGFYVGGKHNFRNPGWLIIVGIGLLFLLERFYPDMSLTEFFWPILLIGAGAFVIVKPHRRKRKWDKEFGKYGYNASDPSCMTVSETNENQIEITAVMGGIKKIVLSKDFQGGEINCILGGAEINLTQADIHGRVKLEVNNILGGTKLLVPANWEVISEVTVVLGGVEDKRPFPHDSQRTSDKTLFLEGSCVMGGIEIKSY